MRRGKTERCRGSRCRRCWWRNEGLKGKRRMTLLTELKEGLGISWSAIRANKLRSALTTLGIIIGIVTVTLMGTAIEGLNRAFLKSVSFIGADVLYVQRFNWFTHTHEEWMKAKKRRPITLTQASAVERQLS